MEVAGRPPPARVPWHRVGRSRAGTIGSDCVLRHATSIGMARTDDETGAPTLGDGVDVGTQVVIIGPITVGDDAIIGAGSVVTRDVEPKTVVAGNPARPIHH